MKKILLAMGVMLFSLNMAAQSFVFCDKDGKVITDGSTITMSEKEEYPFSESGYDIPLKGVYIMNTGSSAALCSVTISVSSMSNGDFQACCFGLCSNIGVGQSTTKKGTIAAGEKSEITMTEWAPATYGTCNSTFQLANGPEININFVYSSTEAISTVNADDNTDVNCGKVIKNGRIVITKGDHEYTTSGAQIN